MSIITLSVRLDVVQGRDLVKRCDGENVSLFVRSGFVVA